MTDLPGQATVGAAVGAVDAGRARAQGELCNTTMLTILYYITYQSVPAGVPVLPRTTPYAAAQRISMRVLKLKIQ